MAGGRLNLNLDIVILIFLLLSLVLHDNPASYLASVQKGIVACRGIIAVAGLSARDLMGYCLVWLGLSGLLIGGTLVILPMQ